MQKLILGFLALLSVNAVAVSPFQLPWMNAEHGTGTYDSKKHPNAVFVIEAYFLGCHYCNVNAPNVHDLAEFYKSDKRVQVLDVGVDRQDSQYAEWIRRHRPKHPVLKDPSKKLVGQLGTTSYPSTYIMDAKGNVVYKTVGVWNSATKQALRNAIEGLLNSDFHDEEAE